MEEERFMILIWAIIFLDMKIIYFILAIKAKTHKLDYTNLKSLCTEMEIE
jgi:hypothetical protein